MGHEQTGIEDDRRKMEVVVQSGEKSGSITVAELEYRLGVPRLCKFVRAHVNIPENAPQRTDFKGLIAMNGNRRVLSSSLHDVVASGHSRQRKPYTLQEADHVFAARSGKVRH